MSVPLYMDVHVKSATGCSAARNAKRRRDHKRGRIPDSVAPILQRLGIAAGTWCDVVQHYGKIFQRIAGTPDSLSREAAARYQRQHQSHSSPLDSPTG